MSGIIQVIKYMLIQSHNNQKGIFEKIIRSKDGQIVRVFFEVYEVNGELKGRIIKAEPILALARAHDESSGSCAFSLSSFSFPLSSSSELVSPYHWTIEKKITSPFSTCNFLTSIKIRAPSNN